MKRYNDTQKRAIFKYYSKTAFAPNHKQRWTYNEIKVVLDREIPDAEIATKLGRSLSAVKHKRKRLIEKGNTYE